MKRAIWFLPFNGFSPRAYLTKIVEEFCRHRPRLRSALYAIDRSGDMIQHAVAEFAPQIIRPNPRSLFIAITANCNFSCKGCHYGRDFMPGHELPLDIALKLLDDAKEAGFSRVRFYGGEPLAHRDLPKMIAHATKLGLKHWITTNGLLLRRKIDELYDAGARDFSLGYYGGNESIYDAYVQRPGAHKRVEDGIAYARQKYRDEIRIELDWVLMRPTCSLEAVEDLYAFADRYRTPVHINLIHYSLPYFLQPGDSGWDEQNLGFHEGDRSLITTVVAELIQRQKRHPDLVTQPLIGLRSIPDWLLKGPSMKVPCMARRLIWVGADGTVQMCYVTFKLGNLHQARLRDMLFSPDHRRAAVDAFNLNCPNCNCSYDSRTMAHAASRRAYAISG